MYTPCVCVANPTKVKPKLKLKVKPKLKPKLRLETFLNSLFYYYYYYSSNSDIFIYNCFIQ